MLDNESCGGQGRSFVPNMAAKRSAATAVAAAAPEEAAESLENILVTATLLVSRCLTAQSLELR